MGQVWLLAEKASVVVWGFRYTSDSATIALVNSLSMVCVWKIALLASRWIGMDVRASIAQLIARNLGRTLRLWNDPTPMSSHVPLAWHWSTSARIGELSTCMKKLDEARIPVETTLVSR